MSAIGPHIVSENETSRALVHHPSENSEPSTSENETALTSDQTEFFARHQEDISHIRTTLDKLKTDIDAGNPQLREAKEESDPILGASYSHKKLIFEANGHQYKVKKPTTDSFEIVRSPKNSMIQDGQRIKLPPSEHGKLSLQFKDFGSHVHTLGVHMTDVFDGQRSGELMCSKSNFPPQLLLDMKNFEIQLLSKLLGNRIEEGA